jgi:hypothetical protein
MGDCATNALLISTPHSILGILHAVSNKLPITATKAPAIAINGCLVMVVVELEDTGSSAGSIMSSNVEVVELMGGGGDVRQHIIFLLDDFIIVRRRRQGGVICLSGSIGKLCQGKMILCVSKAW